MKKYKVLVLAAFLNITACSKQPIIESPIVTPEIFGAVGDGVTDDYTALKAAFSSPKALVLKAGKVYAISGELNIVTNNKSVIGNGAEIRKLNNTKLTISAYQVTGIVLQGLKLTLATPINGGPNPVEQPGIKGNPPYSIYMLACRNYKIENCYIDGSWEMGICNGNCLNGYIHNNTIKNCYRDGTYSQYSVNMTYEGNHYYNIKDDAMSMHDYGIDAQKPEILAAGLPQAGHSKIINNTVDVAYQGISSIGCTDLEISGNVIRNTINSGIAVFNADLLFIGSTAAVSHVNIHNNDIYKACTSQVLNGVKFNDYGQLSTGRAALCVISTGIDGFYTSATRRMSDINISKNTVSYSGANGYILNYIDGLSFSANVATNCNRDQSPYTGSIGEIFNCNNIIVNNNTVNDLNDKGIRHILAYAIKSSAGINRNWNITGTINASKFSIISSNLSSK